LKLICFICIICLNKFIVIIIFNEKNIFIIEDKSPLNKNINTNKNKKKYISFPYISFLFISSLLILNLYYSIKLFKYLRNRDIKFLSNEKELDKNCYKYNTEEGKEKENKNIKINNIKKSINFKDIENTDLNILNIHLLSISFTKVLNIIFQNNFEFCQ
jgi:hypothetical protein